MMCKWTVKLNIGPNLSVSDDDRFVYLSVIGDEAKAIVNLVYDMLNNSAYIDTIKAITIERE
jgi:hypothetical protein